MKKNIKNRRIGTLAFGPCTYLGDPPKHPSWEITKYYSNPHYGKKAEYEYVGGGRYRKKDDKYSRVYIHEGCFNHPESCYTIACWRWDNHEGIFELQVVCNRLLDLNEEERKVFWEIYEYGEEMLNSSSEDSDDEDW